MLRQAKAALFAYCTTAVETLAPTDHRGRGEGARTEFDRLGHISPWGPSPIVAGPEGCLNP
eukprot:14257681-Alexandrium_andersonii.AAC.1